MRVVQEPPAIVIGTMAGNASLFSLDGQCLGKLSQSGETEYSFPIDMRMFNEMKLNNTRKVHSYSMWLQSHFIDYVTNWCCMENNRSGNASPSRGCE